MGWSEPVPKRVRQKIRNCHAAYVASVENPVDWSVPMKGLKTPHRQVPSNKRYRRRGNQGRLKGALLSHFLLQWFIDWRKNVSGRVWPKTVLKKAIQIKGRIREWYRDHGKTCPEMPFLDTSKRGKTVVVQVEGTAPHLFQEMQTKIQGEQGPSPPTL